LSTSLSLSNHNGAEPVAATLRRFADVSTESTNRRQLMSLVGYATVAGAKSGVIKGGTTAKGHEGQITVIATSHVISSPRDAATGMPTGKLQHKPFTITKPVDVASIGLRTALSTNEVLTKVTLQYFAPVVSPTLPTAPPTVLYTVHLNNANVASIDYRQPSTADPKQSSKVDYEIVEFVYQSIDIVWTAGGVTWSDEWNHALS